MPYKFNAGRGHKFSKPKYRVGNWSEYNEALRLRGDLQVWFDEDLLSEWRAPASGKQGDPAAVADLLSGLDSEISRLIADGAYDGKPVHDMARDHCGPDVEIVIPPPVNAISGSYPVRDAHVETIRMKGRMGWQNETGYNQRSRIEAQIGRYKKVIGAALRARRMETQTIEAAIAIKALNRMTRLGRAELRRVA